MRKTQSAVIALALAITGVFVTQSAAMAATGTVNNPSITTLFDGASVPNSLDADANNDTVAVNDKVGFKWSITANDLQDGILSQTIPACWTWDTGTLGSLDTSNSLYESSYVITDNADGSHTLTATVSTVQSGSLGIDFKTLTAIVGSSCANDSTYTPSLDITDGSGTTTQTAAPITVKAETRSDLQKVAGTRTAGTHDFGAGPVAAYYVDYTISIHKPQAGTPSIGAGDTTIALPLSITDTFTPSVAGTTTDLRLVGASLPAGDSATLAGSTLTLSGPTGLDLTVGTYTATVRIWVPASQVPLNGQTPLTIQNTVAAVGGWGIDVNDSDPANNSATGTYIQPGPAQPGPLAGIKQVYVAQDASNPDYQVDPANSTHYGHVSGGAVAPASVVMDRFFFHGPTNPDGTAVGSTNLVAYDFWDPTQQQIIANQGYFVGDGTNTPLPTSDYTVQYTDGTSTTNPDTANTWYNSVAAAGGPSAVSGVRFIYTGGAVYGAGTSGGQVWFLVAVPFRIVGNAGDVVNDTAVWNSGEGNASYAQSVTIQPYALGISKTANKASYISGDAIIYTITPTLAPAPGDLGPVTANPFTVVDTMPSTVTSIDLSALDPEWTATQTTDATGNLVVTFTHVGAASSDQPIPAITYTAQTSIVAPPGNQLTNTAVLSANGTAGPSVTRTVTVQQANVVTKQKVSTVGPNIEVGDPTVSWTSTWVNYQDSSQGASTFVDVLPYNGDGRGTSFNGTATLATATLGGGAATDGTLYYTTDAPATVSDAPAASTNWIDATGVDLSTITGITALKVEDADFAAGDAGVGTLAITLDVDGQLIDDVYANTVTGKTPSFTFGDGTPAEVVVVGSSLSGIVWNDADRSGANNSESGIGGVTVTLYDSTDTVVGTTTTAADGTYTFTQLHSGSYYVTVDKNTVNVALGGATIETYDNTIPLDDNSGTITIAKEEAFVDVNFGYAALTSGLSVVKTTNGVDAATVDDAPTVLTGSPVTWSYVVTNTGETPLSGVTVADTGTNGVVTVTPPSGFDGTLAVGASVTFTATDAATAGLYANTATATGTPTEADGTPIAGTPDVTTTDDSWYVGANPAIVVIKKINGDDAGTKPGVKVDAGSTMDVTFEVTNIGDTDLAAVVVTDDVIAASDISCPQPGLAAGESMTCTASAPAPAPGAQHTNTATVTGTPVVLANGDQLPDVSAIDDANAYVGGAPMVTIVKSINGDDANTAPGVKVAAGSTMDITMVVTNPGNVALENVVVTDDKVDAADISCPQSALAVGESMTCTATFPAPSAGGTHVNTATVSADAPADPGAAVAASTVTDTDVAHAYVPAPILEEPPTEEPPVVEPPVLEPPVEEPPHVDPPAEPKPAPPLAATGAQSLQLTAIVSFALLAGGLLLVAIRRRRASVTAAKLDRGEIGGE